MGCNEDVDAHQFCNPREAEDSEAKFKKTLRMIITLAPKIQCPQEQQILHEWVERLLQPPCTDEDEERRLEYARYLVFQLKRGKLHMPFLECPCPGTLRPLDDVLNLRRKEKLAEEAASKASLLASAEKSTDPACKPTDEEMKRQRLVNFIKCFNPDNITLENFMIAIGPHLKDKGALMTQLVTTEQLNYKNQIEDLYREKELKISTELAREQAGIPERYRLAKQRMLSRAMAGLNYIKSKAPGFQYDRWMENPEYLKNMFKMKQQKVSTTDDSMAEWERKTLQMLHDVNYEAERLEEANTDKEKEIQELRAQSSALEQDFNCKKSKLARKIQELESEKFGYAIANDERDRMIEHLLQDMQNDPADSGGCK